MWHKNDIVEFPPEENTPNEDRASDIRWLVRAGILTVLAAPLVATYWPNMQIALVAAAFFAMSIAAGEVAVVPLKRMVRQRAWSWRFAAAARGIPISLAGLAIQFLVVHNFASRVHAEGIASVVTGRSRMDLMWLALFAVGVVGSVFGLAILLLRRDANALEKGTFDRPEDEPGTRNAIWESNLAKARRGARSLPELGEVFGVVVDDDKRTTLRKLQSPRLGIPARLKFNGSKRSAGGFWGKKGGRVFATVPLECCGEPPIRAVILGISGSGKTTVVRRLGLQLLHNGEDCLVIDGKGDQESVFEFVSLALRANRPFTIDDGRGLDIFNMDSRVAIAALSALFPFRGGDGDEYQKRHMAAIRAAFRGDRIADIDELLNRLSSPTLDSLEPDAYRQLRAPALGGRRGVTQGEETRRALEHYEHVLERLRHPSWNFETSGLVYVKTPMPQEIDYGLVITAAFGAYRGLSDERPGPRYNFIIDEAASLATAENAVDLAQFMEQLRSQGMGFVIVTQSVHGLGQQAERALNAGITLYMANSSDSEMALKVVGTQRQIESGLSRDADRQAKGDSARVQHQYRVTPDRIRELPTGVMLVSTPVPGDPRMGRVNEIVAVGPVAPSTQEERDIVSKTLARASTTFRQLHRPNFPSDEQESLGSAGFDPLSSGSD